MVAVPITTGKKRGGKYIQNVFKLLQICQIYIFERASILSSEDIFQKNAEIGIRITQ